MRQAAGPGRRPRKGSAGSERRASGLQPSRTEERRNPMKRMRMFAIAGLATVCIAGAAFATHVSEVDPATVPTGTLAAHNKVEGIRISSIARAVDRGEADVFVAHTRFAPGQDTGWHTHPGPVFVQVVKGSLTY